MLDFHDKFALNQSNATISIAYNSYWSLSLIESFMKQGPGHCLYFEDCLIFLYFS